MMVDTHIHPLPPDTAKYPIQPVGGAQSDWSLGKSLTVERFLKHMDAAGVEQATLVQASTVHGYDNSYVAECCARYPDRFVGVGCTDPQAPDAPDSLSYWIEERGLKGVRVFAAGGPLPDSYWLDQPQTFPFWERAQQLGIPVAIQMRYYGMGMVAKVAERYPDLRLFLDHMGLPPLEDGPPYAAAQEMLDLSRYPNLYLKFTTHTLHDAHNGRSTVQAWFQTAVDRFGAHRIAWGSNFPANAAESGDPYEGLAAEARQALSFLSQEDQNWLLGETARTLYPDLKMKS